MEKQRQNRFEKDKRRAFYALCAIIITAVLLFIAKSFLLPFICALAVAVMMQPLVRAVCKYTRASRKFVSVFFLSVFFLLLSLILLALSIYLLKELRNLFSGLGGEVKSVLDLIFSLWKRVRSSLFGGAQSELSERLYTLVLSLAESSLASLSRSAAAAATRTVSSLPEFIFSFFIFISASFYMTADYARICEFALSALNDSGKEFVFWLKNKILLTTLRYMRAYLLLAAITFCQLFVAFLIFDIKYALSAAAIIAALDSLPAIGAGVVLIPWSVLSALSGNPSRAISLLFVFAVVWLTRQILEPRIIGSGVGLHPLAALLAFYVGWKLASFIGLFISPIIATLIKNVFFALKVARITEKKKHEPL